MASRPRKCPWQLLTDRDLIILLVIKLYGYLDQQVMIAQKPGWLSNGDLPDESDASHGCQHILHPTTAYVHQYITTEQRKKKLDITRFLETAVRFTLWKLQFKNTFIYFKGCSQPQACMRWWNMWHFAPPARFIICSDFANPKIWLALKRDEGAYWTLDIGRKFLILERLNCLVELHIATQCSTNVL